MLTFWSLTELIGNRSLGSFFFQHSESMDEDDTETLEKKLREKALQSMQRHNKSPEGAAEPDDD